MIRHSEKGWRTGFVKICVGGALALWVAPGVQAADPSSSPEKPQPSTAACPPGQLQAVQQAYQAMAGFQSAFRQEDLNAQGQARQVKGNLSYQKPGKMRWAYAPPDEQLLVTDGQTVWLVDPLLENVTVTPLPSMAKGTPLAFLVGAGNLARDFTCRAPSQPFPNRTLIWMELTPKEDIPTVAFIQVGVWPKSLQLAAIAIIDTTGSRRLVTLDNLKPRAQFPAGHFSFKIPPGMEVIQR
ncbi:MAG: outer membrane lipoprotein carrier protein LolA [Deltaproteobacteria bacterium]|nr:outer membrane lipoprotein carrier protein LolA [Deltaproteobacteria bacterium]